jgi:hypothetical protein
LILLWQVKSSHLEKLQAPLKGFYIFDNSAHSPLFEEPQRVNRIFVGDVLEGKTLMTDK